MNTYQSFKRLAIFATIGPIIGSLAICLLIVPLISFLANDGLQIPSTLGFWIVVLVISYVVGIVPALLVGLIDTLLARRNFSHTLRIAITGTCGFFVSLVPLFSATMMGSIHGSAVLLTGIPGFLAGTICSAIAGHWKGEPHSDSGH